MKGPSVEVQSLLPSSDFNFSVVDITDDLNSPENSLEDKGFIMKMVSYISINIRKILNFVLFGVTKKSYFWHCRNIKPQGETGKRKPGSTS